MGTQSAKILSGAALRRGAAIVFSLVWIFAVLCLLEWTAGLVNPTPIGTKIRQALSPRPALSLVNQPLGAMEQPSSIFQRIRTPAQPRHREKFRLDYSRTNFSQYSQWKEPGVLVPIPNRKIRSRVIYQKKSPNEPDLDLYDVEYVLDAFGRRIVPTAKAKAETHLVLLGGSYAFGEGLENHQTIASQISTQRTDIQSHIVAFHGYGPNDLLAALRASPKLLENLGPPEGVALYLLIPHHLRRPLGYMTDLTRWTRNNALIAHDEKGRLQHVGTFKSMQPWRTGFLVWLGGRQLTQLLNLEWPPWMSQEDHLFVAEILKEIEAEYLGQRPKGKFYVVAAPKGEAIPLGFKAALDQMKIKYLDYSPVGLEQLDYLPLQYPWDGHPNPEGARRIADLILEDLQL